MTRAALALAALITLSLNGSMAVASMPGCSAENVCAVSLRMMTPPPARPADLAQRHAMAIAYVLPVAGQR